MWKKKSKMRVVFFLDDLIKLMKKVNRADTGREKEKETVCVQSQCKKTKRKGLDEPNDDSDGSLNGTKFRKWINTLLNCVFLS